MLSDPSSTTVVVFLDPSRPLGPHSVSLVRALNAWFRQSSPRLSSAQTLPTGRVQVLESASPFVRVVAGDCLTTPGYLTAHGLVSLPAIRVYPAGLRGAIARDVAFTGSARLDAYVRQIEALHAAGADVHNDMDGVAGPAGAIIRQAARLADVRANESSASNVTSAQEAVAGLADAVADSARHIAAQLRLRAERLDMAVTLLSQLGTGLDPAALAADFAATAEALASMPAVISEEDARLNDRTKLQWASTLRLLLEAKQVADTRAQEGGDAVDAMVDELLAA